MATRTLPIWAGLVSAALAAGCGLDETGVRSVEFALEPAPPAELPPGIDPAVVAAVAVSSGTVSADPFEDTGMVMVQGLVEIPADAQYLVMLRFASSERAGLGGGGGGGEVGHTHGAIRTGVLASEGDGLSNVVLGKLTPQEGGPWMAAFTSADVSDQSLGALRGAMIMLIPEVGAAVKMMAGEVEVSTEVDGEGGGHDHGA